MKASGCLFTVCFLAVIAGHHGSAANDVSWTDLVESTKKLISNVATKKEPLKALEKVSEVLSKEAERLRAKYGAKDATNITEQHEVDTVVKKVAKEVTPNVQIVRKSGHLVAMVNQWPKPKPDIIMVCTGLNAKLASFVDKKKVKPLSTAIRSLVSRTYHHLSTRSALLISKHGLHLSESEAKVVLQQAITAAGMSEIVLRNASGHLGERMTNELKSIRPKRLTTLQAMTISNGLSAWLLRKHRELQAIAVDVLKRNQVHLSPPEVQEALLQVLREAPKLPSGQPSEEDRGKRFVAAFLSQIKVNRRLAEPQRKRLAKMALQKVREFARRSRSEVRHLLHRHQVHLSGSDLHELLENSRHHLPVIMEEVHRHLQREAAKVLARLRPSGGHPPELRRVEGYIREVARLANILVHRIVTRNVSALFNRANVTADCNALTEVVHEALLERLGVLPGVPSELRMRVRMAMSYARALALYRSFHREMRREVARVAEVLPSEVEIISLAKDGAVQFRIVAHGFDPERARHLLHRSVVHGHFRIRLGGHRVRAVAPHHHHRRHHRLAWPLLAVGTFALAVLLLGLGAAPLALLIRRRQKAREEAAATAGSEARPCVHSPYAKLEEPSSVYA